MTETVARKLNGCLVGCICCDGSGLVLAMDGTPDECRWCAGSGRNWRYRSGLIAKWYAGPLIGKDTAR